MANKSVIDVDINDKQFKEFYELFQRYKADLGEMPEEWQKADEAARASTEAVGAAAGNLIGTMAAAATHAKNLGDYLRESIEAQKQFGSASKQGEDSLAKMAKNAKAVGESIFGIGKFLFKIGAIGGGIVTGASLFGLDKLAHSAITNERDARGLGLTTGQYRAFDTDYGRYMDPSILSGVANAKNSYTGRMWLARATGMDPAGLEAMDAGDISGKLAIRAHAWWANTPAAQHTDANLQATGFAQSGLTMEDMRRLGATPLGQLQRAQAQYGADSGSLNVGERSTEALYGFARQLTLAGQKLETVLTNKLSELGPALGTLIMDLEKDAEYLINHIFTDANMKGIEEGLRAFATYLGGDDFRKDLQVFVDGLKQIGGAIKWAVDAIHPGSSDSSTPDPGDFESHSKHPYNYTTDQSWNPFAKRTYAGPYYEFFNPRNPGYKQNAEQIAGLESQANLPKGLIAATVAVESSGNPNAVSPKGAVGAMQLMPDTAKQYGVTDRTNFGQSIVGGAAYYRDLFAHYKNDLPTEQLRKSLAAYNWGQGNVDKDVKEYGADWEKHIPKETENQINKILSSLAKVNTGKQDVNITITNKSGTNVAVSTNAASL